MMPFMHRMSPSTMEENPLWLVVLCDMMTNLMLFFLVMFVMTRATPQGRREMIRGFDTGEVIAKEAKDPAVAEFKPDETADKLRKMFLFEAMDGSIEIDSTEKSVRVKLQSKLLFETGRAELEPAAVPALERMAALFNEFPNEVIVEGHTDSVPIKSGPFGTNWELSVGRSYSVLSRLAASGVPPERLVAAGYGPHRPAAANDTPEHRAMNRRVEIVILRREEDH